MVGQTGHPSFPDSLCFILVCSQEERASDFYNKPMLLSTMKCSRFYFSSALQSAAVLSAQGFKSFCSSPVRKLSLFPSEIQSAPCHSSLYSPPDTVPTSRVLKIRLFCSTETDSASPGSNNSSGDDTIPNTNDTRPQQEFASSYHAPVMYQECIDALLKRSHNQPKKKNKYKDQSSAAASSSPNESSMQEEGTRPRIFIDGTLGGGGHSLCLLMNLSPGDILIGCDVDPSALATASMRLRDYIMDKKKKGRTVMGQDQEVDKPIFIPIQSNFRDLEEKAKELRHPVTGELLLFSSIDGSFVGVDGILLDLGVSSHQIDNAERGFAFMKDGPLDMRMWGGKWDNQAKENQTNSHEKTSFEFVERKSGNTNGGLTAADVCNEFTEEEITRILKIYGDEPRARKIAKAIVDSRPLSTTGDLKEAVARVTPEFAKKGRRMGRTATLARVFQALRIVVNEEDKVLRDALETMAPALIRKGGRLVVLSYHSMEDRATKRVMRDGGVDMSSKVIRDNSMYDIYGNHVMNDDGTNGKPWKVLGKKQKASSEEVEMNPRARSATLRVAEKL